MEVKLHFKRYYVFTKYKYISQQLKIPTVQQGTTISDVLKPHPPPPHPTLSSPLQNAWYTPILPPLGGRAETKDA